ncbi:MAG: hypothetical protein DHS20C12_05490 [Pseudohongiella sp.]|nr:MAG: hypothetical protein DHS20C12_05490 [Pseudohongiella sp.]
MQILALVALLAGTAKTAILLFSRTENKLSSAFALVCISMILQNTFEFLVAVTYYTDPALTAQIYHAEIFSIILMAYCMLVFSLVATESNYLKPLSILFGGAALACTYMLVTGQLILGYEHAGYSVISTPAENYYMLPLFVSVTMPFLFGTIAYSALTAPGELRTRSRQLLIAVLPICLVALTVIVLRLSGSNSSTAVFMPLATTFFVAVMVLQQSGRIVIFKIKWTVIWKLAVTMKDVKLSEWVGLVEELLVKEAMRESENNQSEAAKLIKSNQSTVGRKFKKYEGIS